MMDTTSGTTTSNNDNNPKPSASKTNMDHFPCLSIQKSSMPTISQLVEERIKAITITQTLPSTSSSMFNQQPDCSHPLRSTISVEVTGGGSAIGSSGNDIQPQAGVFFQKSATTSSFEQQTKESVLSIFPHERSEKFDINRNKENEKPHHNHHQQQHQTIVTNNSQKTSNKKVNTNKDPIRNARAVARRNQQKPSSNTQNKDVVLLEKILDFHIPTKLDILIDKITYGFSLCHLQSTIFCRQCNDCLDLTLLPMHMVEHIMDGFPNRNGDFCTHCARFFSDADSLHQHKVALFNEIDRNQCNQCALKFFNWSAYYKHVSDKHDRFEIPYRCQHCKFCATTRKRLINHIESIHRTVTCPYCLESFDLHLGILNDSYRNPGSRQKELYLLIQSMYLHLQEHLITADAYACHKCLSNFLTQEELDNHDISHGPIEFSHKEIENIRYETYTEEKRENGELYKKYAVKALFPNIFAKNTKQQQKKSHRSAKCPVSRSNQDGIKTRSQMNNSTSSDIIRYKLNLSKLYKTLENTKPLVLVCYNNRDNDFDCIKQPQLELYDDTLIKLISNSVYFRYLYRIYLAKKYDCFPIKSIMTVSLDEYNRALVRIRQENTLDMTYRRDFLNQFRALTSLTPYQMHCFSCDEVIDDLNTHYSRKRLICKQECHYETYCPRAMYQHLKAVFDKPFDPNQRDSLVFNKNSDPRIKADFDLSKVTQERLQQAKLFDDEYSLDKEIDEIINEFPKDPCPFYLNACMQCCIVFKDFRNAAQHCLELNDNPNLGLVLRTRQSHIIYHRSLIRVFRYEDPIAKLNIERAYLNELIQYRENILEKIHRKLTVFSSSTRSNYDQLWNKKTKNLAFSSKQLYIPPPLMDGNIKMDVDEEDNQSNSDGYARMDVDEDEDEDEDPNDSYFTDDDDGDGDGDDDYNDAHVSNHKKRHGKHHKKPSVVNLLQKHQKHFKQKHRFHKW